MHLENLHTRTHTRREHSTAQHSTAQQWTEINQEQDGGGVREFASIVGSKQMGLRSGFKCTGCDSVVSVHEAGNSRERSSTGKRAMSKIILNSLAPV